ncbi:MAG: GTPase ObgE [Melioribacteraceae bacterium]|nr:GTPase ObgE [Melioribacteraceae bacterium]
MFIDESKIFVRSGDGGDGAVAFRREKYVPKGGPAGGNGGKGGNVVFIADRNINTLINFKYKRKFAAGNGQKGANFLKDGKDGKDVVIKVPVGTIIRDLSSNEILADLDEDGSEVILLKGGKGGKGNSNFATSTNQTPRFAENGKPGVEKEIILELKLIADVGLVGFPNAGKSTFISAVSAARPKIADYPFTTLEPNLGIVKYSDFSSFVIADIPGIIEGAHKGKGLGIRFLKHIERTRILLILIDVTDENYRETYKIILNELSKFSAEVASKKKVLAFTKMDMLDSDASKKTGKRSLKGFPESTFFISSVSGFNIKSLLDSLWHSLND